MASFGDLGGLETLKAFCLKALRTRQAGEAVTPRGILLLGVPGTGKSAFAKSLGNQTGSTRFSRPSTRRHDRPGARARPTSSGGRT